MEGFFILHYDLVDDLNCIHVKAHMYDRGIERESVGGLLLLSHVSVLHFFMALYCDFS